MADKLSNTLSDHIESMGKTSLGTSVTLTTSPYTTTSDGYVRLSTNSGWLFYNGAYFAKSTSSDQSMSVYVKKGVELKTESNGGSLFWPLV